VSDERYAFVSWRWILVLSCLRLRSALEEYQQARAAFQSAEWMQEGANNRKMEIRDSASGRDERQAMRAQTENERIATRRIAKAIIEQGGQEAWSKLTEDMVAGRIAMAVARHSAMHGIDPLYIKSSIYRITHNREL
jgi:hypothetical protein